MSRNPTTPAGMYRAEIMSKYNVTMIEIQRTTGMSRQRIESAHNSIHQAPDGPFRLLEVLCIGVSTIKEQNEH